MSSLTVHALICTVEAMMHNCYGPRSETMEQVFQHTMEISFTKGCNENEYEDFQPENHIPKLESRALSTCGGLPPFKNYSSSYTGPGL